MSVERADGDVVATVVVPFFESAGTIAACVDALLEQRGVGGAYEIVFVDNASTDGSRELVDGRDGVTVFEERTPGAYAARNAGIRRASGPVIAFTDADCVVAPNWLATILGVFRDERVGAVVGRCHYPADASFALRLLGAYENAKTDYVLSRCAPAHRFGYTNNMAVRASLFAELGPFREWKRAADSEFVHRLAVERPDLRFVYEPAMTMTHLEFTSCRDRARRLSLYTGTNTQIDTFRELTVFQRLAIVARLVCGGGR